jgi:hypothetical protein
VRLEPGTTDCVCINFRPLSGVPRRVSSRTTPAYGTIIGRESSPLSELLVDASRSPGTAKRKEASIILRSQCRPEREEFEFRLAADAPFRGSVSI